MTEPVTIALISAGLPTLASLAAVVQTRRTRRDLAGPIGDARPLGERVASLEATSAEHGRSLVRIESKLDGRGSVTP